MLKGVSIFRYPAHLTIFRFLFLRRKPINFIQRKNFGQRSIKGAVSGSRHDAAAKLDGDGASNRTLHSLYVLVVLSSLLSPRCYRFAIFLTPFAAFSGPPRTADR